MCQAGKKEPPLGHHVLVVGGPPQVFGSPRFAILVLVVAVLACYANSFRCPFVFDDSHDIIDNLSIRRLRPLADVFFVRSERAMELRSRPVVNLSFALDYAVGGLRTLPYHVTNLAIHILAALALFGIVRRTLLLPRFRDRFGPASAALALAAALLWAVHPLQTESVTYITQRYESMMGLFYLVAVYGLIRCGGNVGHLAKGPEMPQIGNLPHTGGGPFFWGAVTVAATLLSLGSKEVAVSLPIMLLLCDRVLLSGSFAEIGRRRWGLYLALLAVWAVFAAVQLRAGPRPWAGYALPLTWFEYARSEPGVILHYLRLVFWPHPLVLDYGWLPARTVGEILPGTIVVAGLLAATGYAIWRWPAWGLLGAWFFLILAPTSSVMPLADLAFEHRMYLPLAAVAVAVVLGVYALAEALSARCRATLLACLLGGVVLALAVVTWQRNNDYGDTLRLWQGVVARCPNHPRAHVHVGLALAGRGQVEEAIAHYRKALDIQPDCVEACVQLGFVSFSRGDVDEAIAHYRKALEIRPDCVEAHNNLGLALVDRGQVDDAIAQYGKALDISPDYADAHYNLGLALANRGQSGEAIAHYRKALDIKPDCYPAHTSLGDALAARGQVEEAIDHYRKALKIEPGYLDAHTSLGVALANRGQVDEAIACFRKVLAMLPDYAPAQYHLGLALAGRGQVEEAIAHYRKALDIARQQNNQALADSVQAELRLCEAGKPEPPPASAKPSIQPSGPTRK